MKAKKYTAAEWKRAFRWGTDFLGLEDWDFALDWRSWPPAALPDGVGHSAIARMAKRAKLWVHPDNCHKYGHHVFSVLFHEMLHVAFEDVGLPTPGEDHEFLLNRLEKAVLAAYRKGVT